MNENRVQIAAGYLLFLVSLSVSAIDTKNIHVDYDPDSGEMSVLTQGHTKFEVLRAISSKANIQISSTSPIQPDLPMGNLPTLSLELNKVPLERVLNLVLGGTNRLVMYKNTRSKYIVEKIHLISDKTTHKQYSPLKPRSNIAMDVSANFLPKEPGDSENARLKNLSDIKRSRRLRREHNARKLAASENRLLSSMGYIEPNSTFLNKSVASAFVAAQ